jgi:signal transduction histidine kinase/ligand-binding sensor domain-containing protein
MLVLIKILKRIILVALFFYCSNIVASDVISTREEQEGLLFLSVSSIVKDQKGFMWFGTNKGLNRWDGYKYKYFLSDKNDSTTISSNKVQALLVDSHGYMWVATPNGLNRFNPETETFTRYTNNPKDTKSISSNSINCFDEDQDGNLWIGTDNGINIFSRKTNSFKYINTEQRIKIPSENYSAVRFISCDKDGMVWVGFTVSGLLRIDTKTLKHHFILKDDLGNYLSSINGVVDLGNNSMLIATWGNKIFQLSKETNTVVPWEGNKLLKSSVTDFIDIDKYGNLWITDHYQQILNISQNLEILNKYSTNSSLKVPSTQISTTFVDDENIWFGTYNQGYFHITIKKKRINNLSIASSALNALSDIQVASIDQNEEGDIFIGTSNNKLFIYNEISGAVKELNTSSDILTRLYFDPFQNRLYLGTYSSKVSYIDLTTFEEKTLANYSSNYAQVNFAGTNDKLFIALWGQGITVVDGKNSIKFLGTEKWEKSFSALNMFIEDSLLWIASYNDGIVKYNLNSTKFTRYLIKDETQSLFATNQINLIKRLRSGKMLVSSNDLGLCFFDERSANFTQVGVDAGINNLHIKAIFEKDNLIWIVSEQKIISTDENFKSISTYTIYDGLNFGIEHLAAILSSNSKKLYIGGQDGIQYLNTSEKIDDQPLNNVTITDIRIFEKSIPLQSKILKGKSISYTDSITLTHKENFITIDFSQMLYYDKIQSPYSYKLEGVNTEWITVPYNRNSVTYSNLSHGKYTFMVKAANTNDKLQAKITHLHIIVTPPFWETPMFRILLLVSLIAFIGGYFKLQEKKYRKEKRKLEEMVQVRTTEILEKNQLLETQKDELIKANEVKNKFFSIIAHDLKNPVASYVQLIELARENLMTFSPEQLQEIINAAANSAVSTLDLLEELLLWARTQTNKIEFHFEKINIYELTKNEVYFLFPQAINKQIIIINNLPLEAYVFADVNSTKTVIRNLLTNAIKFSKIEGTIRVGCQIRRNEMIIYIKDNGIGMDYTMLEKLFDLSEKKLSEGTSGEKGTGLGLNLCKEFVEKNGGRIWAESTKNVGSTFFFSLPLAEK